MEDQPELSIPPLSLTLDQNQGRQLRIPMPKAHRPKSAFSDEGYHSPVNTISGNIA